MENRITKFLKLDELDCQQEKKSMGLGTWTIITPEGDTVETDSIMFSAKDIKLNGKELQAHLTVMNGHWPDKELLIHLDRLTVRVAETVSDRMLKRLFGEES